MNVKLRLILIGFIFVFFVTHFYLPLTAQPRHPFYDALQLDEAIDADNHPQILSILAAYTDKQSLTGIEEAKEAFKDNPFIYDQIRKISTPPARRVTSGEENKKPRQVGYGPGVSGILSPTMMVETLANFISKRFKEELIISFFAGFRKKLIETKALRLFFPSTCAFLFQSNPYDVQSFISTLREIFHDDLDNMAGNLARFLKENENDITDKDTYHMLLVSHDLIHSLRDGLLAIDIVSGLDELSCITGHSSNFSHSIRLLALVSRNLKNRQEDGWISPHELNRLTLTSNKRLRELFVGLIYAREKDKFSTLTFDSRLLIEILSTGKGTEEAIKEFNRYMCDISLKAKTARNHLKQLKNRDDIGAEDYFNYIASVIDIFDSGLNTGGFTGVMNIGKIWSTYLPTAETMLEIYKNIHKGTYGVALTHALNLCQKLLPPSLGHHDILRYGVFMIGMVNAKTPDEMLEVMKTTALPVGGYRVKRSRPFSVSLNTYPGLFLGGETLDTDESIQGNKTGLSGAITTPVGIALNLGTANKNKKEDNQSGVSWSLFLSAIDVGAVFSWRITGNDPGLPELKWQNFLAPGLFIIYGFKNSPLSLGAGVQYGPQLRKITIENGLEMESSAFRFGLIFVVDIPIFNIFSQ